MGVGPDRDGAGGGVRLSEETIPRVISASRRTDIPAWHSEWLLERLAEGRCRFLHAMRRRWVEVDLTPEAVRALVLWSKDLGPLLPHLPTIAERYPFYCQLTITGHPASLEPHAPPWEEAVRQARQVAAEFGSAHIVWRFDPIVLTPQTPWSDHRERFLRIADALEGSTTRCVISFVSVYGKVRRRFDALGFAVDEPGDDAMAEMAHELLAEARARGMVLSACCMRGLTERGIARARCIDPEILAEVGMREGPRLKAAPSRAGCGCAESIDIGTYDTCRTGCVYCYAGSWIRRPKE